MKSPQEVGSLESRVRSPKTRNQKPGARNHKPVGSGQKEELESLIAQAYSRGFAVHGDIELSLEAFAAHVNRIINKSRGQRSEVGDQRSEVSGLLKNPEQQPDPMTALAKLHTEDLYLAAACALTYSNAAWVRLELLYGRYISTVARSVCSVHTEAVDVANNMLSHLFLPDRQGQRRIASYQGRGPLCAWLAMIVKRQALNHRQLKSNESLPLDTLRHTPRTSAASDIETALLDSEYGEAIVDSFRAALETLSERERLVLALHVGDELTAAEIARRFRVHKSQPTCILHRIEHKLRAALFTRLGTGAIKNWAWVGRVSAFESSFREFSGSQ
jgi:RNA polymerase sigma-70 factor